MDIEVLRFEYRATDQACPLSTIRLKVPAAFYAIPMANWKKLLRLFFDFDVYNKDALEEFHAILLKDIDAKKAEWKIASKNYVDNFTDTSFIGLTKKEIIEGNKKNKLYGNALKKAKNAHERAVKIEKLFDDLNK